MKRIVWIATQNHFSEDVASNGMHSIRCIRCTYKMRTGLKWKSVNSDYVFFFVCSSLLLSTLFRFFSCLYFLPMLIHFVLSRELKKNELCAFSVNTNARNTELLSILCHFSRLFVYRRTHQKHSLHHCCAFSLWPAQKRKKATDFL